MTAGPAPLPRTMRGELWYRDVVMAKRLSVPSTVAAGCPAGTASSPTRAVLPSEASKVAERLAVGTRLFLPLLDGLGEPDQRLDGDVVGLDGVARRPREDEELARNVGAAQIFARIGLGVAFLASILESGFEAHSFSQLVEEVAQRSREDAFDALDRVAGSDQVFYRTKDGETCAGGGLVIEPSVLHQLLELGHRSRQRNLVGGDDGDVMR